MKRLLIIAAMDEEQNYFIERMKEKGNVSTKSIAFGLPLTQGMIHSHHVSIVLSGIGKTNAAIATTLAIEYVKPSLIINIGVAGGLLTSQKPLDFVIADEVRYHDVDLTPFGYKRGQVPKMPEYFIPKLDLAKKMLECAQELSITSYLGGVLCGDQFVSSASMQEDLQNFSPKSRAIDMESGSIAQVAFLYKIPFLIARSLSDNGDGEASLTYKEFLNKASDNSGRVLVNFLEQFSF